MKLIVHNESLEIKYAFPDGALVGLLVDRIVTPDFVIADLNENNAVMIEGVASLPEDFVGCKYLWQEGEFAPNPAYVEPVNDLEALQS